MHNADFVNALKEALGGLCTVHAVGEEWCSYIGKIPAGGVPYCGQEVQRETYSALWAYANAQGLVKPENEWQSIYASQGGNVPFYSLGNGSSTFRMPCLVGYVRGASSQSESGAYVAEGLPNIEGSFVPWAYCYYENEISESLNPTGAFDALNNRQRAYNTGENTNGGTIYFDASRSSPIYGKSSHVTPETSCVLFGVYAFGKISDVGSLDVSTLASAIARAESNLQSKLDIGTVHIVESWRDGSSWYRKYSDGFIEQGGIIASVSGNGYGNATITLNTAFTTTTYVALATQDDNGQMLGYDSATNGQSIHKKATTYFTLTLYSLTYGRNWYACGY